MTKFGVDYATAVSNPAVITKLKQGGVEFVCRYISSPGNPKNINTAELAALRAAGLPVVIVFETTANRALGGAPSGKFDATSALNQIKALGTPDAIVYFAVDFNVGSANEISVEEYFRAVVGVLGYERVGAYGGLRIITRLLNRKVCKWAWQTYAWSGGKWDLRAHIRQYKNGQNIAGVSVDYDLAMFSDFGQWPRPVPVVVPAEVKTWSKPPWLVWAGGKQIGRGRLINPALIVRISKALRAAGKEPLYTAHLLTGGFIATGQFWPPGKFTRAISGHLRLGQDVSINGVITIKAP